MPFPISLSQADYESLVELARRGTLNSDGSVNQDKALGLEAWLQRIELANHVHRYEIWVQWQEQGMPLPAGTDFPNSWPPSLREHLALTSRPIARSDVEQLLRHKARQPTSVLVTRDPAARVGWTELDVFFK